MHRIYPNPSASPGACDGGSSLARGRWGFRGVARASWLIVTVLLLGVCLAVLWRSRSHASAVPVHFLQIHGTVSALDATNGMTVDVDRVLVHPVERMARLDPVRPKRVLLGSSTGIVDENSEALDMSAIRPGVEVDVVGPDDGIGTPLRAIVVAVHRSYFTDWVRIAIEHPGWGAPPIRDAKKPQDRLAALVDDDIPQRFLGHVVLNPPKGFPDKLVALTFDDGPNATRTPAILATLEAFGVHATFFVLGCNIQRYPDLLREIVQQGHSVGVHSFSHPVWCSPQAAAREIVRTAALVEAATGRPPHLFRPPYGLVHSNLSIYAIHAGYALLLWTEDSRDWEQSESEEELTDLALQWVRPGSVILLHDGVGRLTPEALPGILSTLQAEGYTCVTIPEMLRAWDKYMSKTAKTPVTGTVRNLSSGQAHAPTTTRS